MVSNKHSFASHSDKLKQQLTRLPWWVPMVVHGRKVVYQGYNQGGKLIDGSSLFFFFGYNDGSSL